MKSQEARIAELEQIVRVLQRDMAKVACREANVTLPRRGWHLGKLDGALNHDGTATVSVLKWSVTLSQWQDTGVNIEGVRDIFLNDGESHATGTIVKIEYDDTTWVVTQAYCSADDEDTGAE
jgi:hypothetical protein